MKETILALLILCAFAGIALAYDALPVGMTYGIAWGFTIFFGGLLVLFSFWLAKMVFTERDQ